MGEIKCLSSIEFGENGKIQKRSVHTVFWTKANDNYSKLKIHKTMIPVKIFSRKFLNFMVDELNITQNHFFYCKGTLFTNS